MDCEIRIKHVTRVEGHANIVLNLKAGTVEELRIEIVESPRFFELMLRGRRLEEAPAITSRICGICAVSHTLASIKASEALLGVEVTEETVALRKILLSAETIQSHILHLCFLVLPDFFGVDSIIELSRAEPDLVARALRLKGAANGVCSLLVGRHVHPIGVAIGGFRRQPTMAELNEVRALFEAAKEDIDGLVEVFEAFEVTEFRAPTNHISLSNDTEYALYDGVVLLSSDGRRVRPEDFSELVSEEVVSYSTAKHATVDKESIMVGALSRLSNNFGALRPEAAVAARRLSVDAATENPFRINHAQLVEVVHLIYDSGRLLDALSGVDSEPAQYEPRAGSGLGAIEAPRGTLYHEYQTDCSGVITSVDCLIPTAQNLANMEKDIRALVPLIAGKTKEEITRSIEMLLRAYDPCISCSTHLVKVDFVD